MISFKIKIIDYLSNRFVRKHIYIIATTPTTKRVSIWIFFFNFIIQYHVKNHCKDAVLFIFSFLFWFIFYYILMIIGVQVIISTRSWQSCHSDTTWRQCVMSFFILTLRFWFLFCRTELCFDLCRKCAPLLEWFMKINSYQIDTVMLTVIW